MKIFSRYLLRRIAAPVMLSLVIALLALSLERLLRIVQGIAEEGGSLARALELLGYLVPHYLGLAVPVALFVGIMLAFSSLSASNELTAMLNTGIPLRRLSRSIFALAAVLAGVMLINAAVVQPYSRYAYRATLHELTKTSLAVRLRPGVFYRVNDQLVLRADEVVRDGGLLRGFFAEVRRADGERLVITASRAQLLREPESDTLVAEMQDGIIVRGKGGAGSGTITFSNYTVALPVEIEAPYGPRGRNERELTLLELAQGRAPIDGLVTADGMRAELYSRIVHALSLPLLAVLAIPLGLIGSGRGGRAYGIALGIGALVLYQKMLSLAAAFAGAGTVPAWVAFGPPLLVLSGTAYLLFAYASESNGGSLAGWIRRRPRADLAEWARGSPG